MSVVTACIIFKFQLLRQLRAGVDTHVRGWLALVCGAGYFPVIFIAHHYAYTALCTAFKRDAASAAGALQDPPKEVQALLKRKGIRGTLETAMEE